MRISIISHLVYGKYIISVDGKRSGLMMTTMRRKYEIFLLDWAAGWETNIKMSRLQVNDDSHVTGRKKGSYDLAAVLSVLVRQSQVIALVSVRTQSTLRF